MRDATGSEDAALAYGTMGSFKKKLNEALAKDKFKDAKVTPRNWVRRWTGGQKGRSQKEE